jgi:hypothetical protein
MGDEMTWDDGLSLDALGQFLRRVAVDAVPLLLFCIDSSRYMRHCQSRAGKSGYADTPPHSPRAVPLTPARAPC